MEDSIHICTFFSNLKEGDSIYVYKVKAKPDIKPVGDEWRVTEDAYLGALGDRVVVHAEHLLSGKARYFYMDPDMEAELLDDNVAVVTDRKLLEPFLKHLKEDSDE